MSERVQHWQPLSGIPGYETRLNKDGHRETRPIKNPIGIPMGFAQVPHAVVFMSATEIIVLGEPAGEDEAEDGHSCDAMGCGWNHVLYRHKFKQEAIGDSVGNAEGEVSPQ